MPSGGIGMHRLGGPSSGCSNCRNKNCLLPMSYTGMKTNNFYYKPGDRASWARRSKAGGGQNWGAKSGARIGVNRLGGTGKN